MTKTLQKLLLILVILSLGLFSITFTGIQVKNAEAKTVKIEFYVGAVTANVNGSTVALDVPVIIDKSCNRTLVPLRFVAESFGAKVGWNAKAKEISITLSGKTINLWIGKKEAMINNNAVKMDCAPKIFFSRTIVPIRFISEAFGAKVEWDAKTRKITILFEQTATPSQNDKILKADPNAVSMTTKTVKIGGETKKVVFYIVKINLKGKNITIAPYLTDGGLHTAGSASSFESKIKPIAMVNGGTFDLTYYIPTGDIVRNGIPQFIRNDGYEYRETMGITKNKTPFFADGTTKYTAVIDGKEFPLTSVNGMWHGTIKLYTNWYKSSLNVADNEILLVVENRKVISEKSGTTFYPATMKDDEYALLLPVGLVSTPVKSAYIKISINGQDYSGGTFVKCGPLLLKNGRAYLDYSRYAYLNRTQKKGARSILAFDKNGNMYFIFTPTPVRLNYGDLSVALEKLGFLDYAISLDGGGSTLLYYKGTYITRPGRKIVSVIAVPSEIQTGTP